MTLEQWFKAAIEHGAVYYVQESRARSGMSASYSLYTIKDGHLVRAWPLSAKGVEGWDYDEKLAKALGFRLSKRAWYRQGCGYDRVHDVLYCMARHFGIDLKSVNGISRESLHSS